MLRIWTVVFERPVKDKFGSFESTSESVLTDSIDRALEWAKENMPQDYPMIKRNLCGSM